MYDEPTSFAQPWNFGPLLDNENLTVSQLNSQIISEWGSGNYNNTSQDEPHEANLLMLDSSKAINKLNWHPVYSIKEAITKTITWYKEYFTNKDNMEKFTQDQILEYVEQAKKMNLDWVSKV